jgi:hypothetical protein
LPSSADDTIVPATSSQVADPKLNALETAIE